eukprot:6474368-Amphidinium_carterae.1
MSRGPAMKCATTDSASETLHGPTLASRTLCGLLAIAIKAYTQLPVNPVPTRMHVRRTQTLSISSHPQATKESRGTGVEEN